MTAQAPLLVAGMHRSGTSMTASLIEAMGVSLGDRLLEGDRHNATGYFEDLDVVAFHGAVLKAATPPDEPGWHDWGWTESESLDTRSFAAHAEAARQLLDAKRAAGTWGFKDPRTTLFLDFWRDLLPDARFVLVYRAPWDVVDSAIRVSNSYFDAHPEQLFAAWAFYNRRVLDFHAAHPDLTVLVHCRRVLEEPSRFASLLAERLGLPTAAPEALGDRLQPGLMRTLDDAHPLVGLTRTHAPEAVRLYDALEAAADMSAGIPAGTGVPHLRLALERDVAHYRLRDAVGALRAERDAVLDSTIWRATAGLRQLIEAVRGRAGR